MREAPRPAAVIGHTARGRLERLLFLSGGIAAIVYGGVLFPGSGGIKGQTPQLEAWYGYGLVGIAIVVPLCLAALTWVLPLRTMRRLAGATSIVFVFAMTLFPSALLTGQLGDGAYPWYQGIHALHGMLAAIAWQRRGVWLYGLAQGVVIGVVSSAVRDDAVKAAALDGIGSFVFIVILMAATVSILGAADKLDAASVAARDLAAITASARTREREETRINAMVHDDIMSVLLTASRANPSPVLQERAQVALAAIDALETSDATARTYAVAEAVTTFTNVVRRVAPDAEVRHDEAEGPGLPADVVTALSDALAEALRNSVRHAGGEGDTVDRTVDILPHARGIRVVVRDRGKGFNTRAIASRRLGIRLSIIERMGMVTGGVAEVQSRPGDGTTVSLAWERP